MHWNLADSAFIHSIKWVAPPPKSTKSNPPQQYNNMRNIRQDPERQQRESEAQARAQLERLAHENRLREGLARKEKEEQRRKNERERQFYEAHLKRLCEGQERVKRENEEKAAERELQNHEAHLKRLREGKARKEREKEEREERQKEDDRQEHERNLQEADLREAEGLAQGEVESNRKSKGIEEEVERSHGNGHNGGSGRGTRDKGSQCEILSLSLRREGEVGMDRWWERRGSWCGGTFVCFSFVWFESRSWWLEFGFSFLLWFCFVSRYGNREGVCG